MLRLDHLFVFFLACGSRDAWRVIPSLQRNYCTWKSCECRTKTHRSRHSLRHACLAEFVARARSRVGTRDSASLSVWGNQSLWCHSNRDPSRAAYMRGTRCLRKTLCRHGWAWLDGRRAWCSHWMLPLRWHFEHLHRVHLDSQASIGGFESVLLKTESDFQAYSQEVAKLPLSSEC